MSDELNARTLSDQADRQRRRSIAILGGLGGFLLVAFLIAFAAVQGWLPSSSSPSGETQAAGATPSCVAPSLPPVSEVTVNVYNSTGRVGLAGTTARSLRQQGFVVAQVENDPLQKQVAGVAEIRYGSAGAAKAKTLELRFPGAVLVDDGRGGEMVDVAVGAGFTAVGTATAAPMATTC